MANTCVICCSTQAKCRLFNLDFKLLQIVEGHREERQHKAISSKGICNLTCNKIRIFFSKTTDVQRGQEYLCKTSGLWCGKKSMCLLLLFSLLSLPWCGATYSMQYVSRQLNYSQQVCSAAVKRAVSHEKVTTSNLIKTLLCYHYEKESTAALTRV